MNVPLGRMALAAGCFLISAACASEPLSGLYFAPKIGVSHGSGRLMGEDSENGWFGLGRKKDFAFAGGAALGIDWHDRQKAPVRLEAEYLHLGRMEAGHEGETLARVDAQTVFANIYYDIRSLTDQREKTAYVPYVGAGAGMAFLSITDPSNHLGKGKANNFAWNIGGGIAAELSRRFTLDVGYRFTYMGDLRTDTYHEPGYWARGGTDDNVSHQILVGFRVKF